MSASQSEERSTAARTSLRAALTEAADRIEELLAIAEEAASRIVNEGQARADRILEESEGRARGARGRGEAWSAAARSARQPLRAEAGPDFPPAARGADEPAGRLETALDLAVEVAQRAELTARDAHALSGAASRLRSIMVDLVGEVPGEAHPASRPDGGAAPAEDSSRASSGHGVDGAGAGTTPLAAPDPRELQPTSSNSRSGDPGEAQLLAVQMAVAGSSDDEIETVLRQRFGAGEVDRALAAVRKIETGLR